MKPIRLLDAAFLHAETPATPMHVGALFLLDVAASRARKPFFERFRAHVAGRLGDSEVFTRKLAPLPFGLANPLWVTTTAIDLDHHVRRWRLPRPGTQRQLENRVARLHEKLLDRDRPLWEFHVIEGLASGEVGLYVKVHHAGLDGHSGQLFMQAFTDPGPRPAGGRQRSRLPADDDPEPSALWIAGLRHQLAETRRLPARLAAFTRAATGLLRAGDRDAPATPRTVLNSPITGRRSFATTVIPLDAVRGLARRAGVTVNDLMLSLCAGALRRWLLRRGLLPGEPLSAGVPVSARAAGDLELAIRVAFMSVNLHTGAADPLARLAAVHQSAESAKQNLRSFKALIPEDLPSVGLPWLLAGFSQLAAHEEFAARVPLPFNVIVSNVPGPPQPLYVAGARVKTYLPMSIVFHGVGLNVSMFSYDGSLQVGFTSCTDLLPDVDSLARYLDDELAVLGTALAAAPAKRRRTPRRRGAGD